MGSYTAGFPESFDNFDFSYQIDFSNLGNGFYLDDQSLLEIPSPFPPPPPPPHPEPYSQQNLAAAADADFSGSVLKYISQVLMEEDMEEKPCMFHDALSLQAAEKSLYEALGEKYPDSVTLTTSSPVQLAHSPDGSSSGYASSTTTTTSADWSFDCLENNRPSWLNTPIPNNFVFQSTSTRYSPKSVGGSNASFRSSFSDDLVSKMFNDSELAFQFKRGVEEASKFLPKSTQLVIDVENHTLAFGSKANDPKENNSVPYRLTGKKSHWREDEHLAEERSKKQSAANVDETELSEMFDKILLFGRPKEKPLCILHKNFLKKAAKDSSLSKGHKSDTTKQTSGQKPTASGNSYVKDIPDLRTLLVSCTQAVSINDRKTADELLRQVRLHSSSYGDGTERLAHYFANSLEARLAGIGTQVYTALSAKKTSASDMLKACQTDRVWLSLYCK